MSKGCYSYAQHADAGKVFVTSVGNKLEIVRPFPQHAVPRIGANKCFVVCDGRRCGGPERCCYAHSQAEADVWNTMLAASRGLLPTASRPTYPTNPVQHQPQGVFVPSSRFVPAQPPATDSRTVLVKGAETSWPELPNVRTIAKRCIMQRVDTISLSVRIHASVCVGGGFLRIVLLKTITHTEIGDVVQLPLESICILYQLYL